jgi:hypothetical protein
MPTIYNSQTPFDLKQLKLTNPVSKNGAHFIKTLAGEDPLYFLAPKCFVKQGFVSHGKKTFCDFVFSTEDSEFLNWIETLEETVREGLYKNREKWFETALDEHDIESSLASPYKPYKSGKYFIIRANVPTALGKINIKIYDEQEKETEPENIKENTNVMVVFEFQGIRCSVRSFQFEIVLKQMLVVEPEKLFERCIIQKSSVPSSSQQIQSVEDAEDDDDDDDAKEEDALTLTTESIKTVEPTIKTEIPTFNPTVSSLASSLATTESPDATATSLASTESLVLSTEPIEIVEVDLEDDAPPIQLKNRNDVYYKLYKEARAKAREAKQLAIANYLEAKRIKNTYLLNDVSDSDPEEDNDEDDDDDYK